ncbi:sensor histidine kinase [Geosporobacter ferrireducens]|uniref:histidine kinase n=1 Tax=Geosporobacter ferrireducens TaxID=1424294 RepID=A0A1D8GFR1_9FIRM|nr:HAMP domain-containing sensor histidine kinase [Geosporobacter ferrireducens]AOT69736.1 hypothetical protein Gferi_09155 [Geosporobacter ferrireducens]
MKSILSKLWFGITAVVLLILLIIWLFQISFLNEFYIRERKSILLNEAQKLRSLMLESDDSSAISQEMLEEIQHFTTSINAIVMIVDKKKDILFVNTPGRIFINNREPDKNDRRFLAPVLGDKTIERYIAQGEPFVIQKMHSRSPEGSVIVGVPVFRAEELVGNVVIFTALAPIEEATSILKKQLSIITIFSLCIGTVLALSLAKFFAKPIVNIIDASKRIAKGDFSVEILHSSNDEIGVLGETINDLARQLDKIEQLRKDFIANVSHELKTPISLIKAYAEVVKDVDNFDAEDKEQYLQVIIDESDRLNNMVEDILYLSKMESGYSDLVYEKFSLQEILDYIIEKLSYFASKNDIEIVLEMESQNLLIYADKNKIYQVFYNIIDNAIHHSYNHGRIIIKICEKDDVMRVEVIDNGKGIPKEDLPYIWDRFYKVDKSRKRDSSGTGLGMAIVKNILQAHKFPFGIESEVNKGTVVWIEMPSPELI